MKQTALKLFGKMTNRFSRLILLAVIPAGLLFFTTALVWAQTGPTVNNAKRDADEKDGCIRNLKLIYAAIQSYRFDHKEMPNWLSDLVPQYLADTSILICPVCKRTGETDTSPLADPKIPSSYSYQFSPVPLGTNNPDWTWREWKRKQMGLAGSSVPLVCCRFHGVVLNLGFDGRVYESQGSWETLLTNQMNIADLAPEQIFGNGAKSTNAASNGPVATSPPGGHPAKTILIDLTPYYNVALTNSWLSGTNNDLASLPAGTQTLAGEDFDARGLIQLAGKKDTTKHFPNEVKGIKLQQKCGQLHFLHAAAFGSLTDDEGREIGDYVVHYANQTQTNIPIIYGRDVRDWQLRKGEKPPPKELTVVWTGSNPAATAAHRSLRLFATTWDNPFPEVEIDEIDFVSETHGAAPFLLAITAH